jgi:hypothetical protein
MTDQRGWSSVLIAIALSMLPGACQVPAASLGPDPEEHLSSFDGSICRVRIRNDREPLELFDLSAGLGGRVCVKDEQTLLFFQNRGTCSLEDPLVLDGGVQMTVSEAEREFWRCTAVAAQPKNHPTETVVLWSPTDRQGSSPDQLRFISNLELLVTNDGLPVSYYAMVDGTVCMETDDAAGVIDWIASADLVRPLDARVEGGRGTCDENAPKVTGRPWSPPRPTIPD